VTLVSLVFYVVLVVAGLAGSFALVSYLIRFGLWPR